MFPRISFRLPTGKSYHCMFDQSSLSVEISGLFLSLVSPLPQRSRSLSGFSSPALLMLSYDIPSVRFPSGAGTPPTPLSRCASRKIIPSSPVSPVLDLQIFYSSVCFLLDSQAPYLACQDPVAVLLEILNGLVVEFSFSASPETVKRVSFPFYGGHLKFLLGRWLFQS